MDEIRGIPHHHLYSKLPRFALAVFAARASRRVQPLFVLAWPDAPDEHVRAIETAVAHVEAEAERGDLIKVAKLKFHPMHAASRAAEAASAALSEHAGRNGGAVRAAYSAKYASISAKIGSYSTLAVEYAATTPAHLFASDVPYRELLQGIARDYDDIKRIVDDAGEAWTDATPLSPARCGPLWPQGDPWGYPSWNS